MENLVALRYVPVASMTLDAYSNDRSRGLTDCVRSLLRAMDNCSRTKSLYVRLFRANGWQQEWDGVESALAHIVCKQVTIIATRLATDYIGTHKLTALAT